MRFILEKAKICRYIERMAIPLSDFEIKKNNDEDLIQKIYA